MESEDEDVEARQGLVGDRVLFDAEEGGIRINGENWQGDDTDE